MLAAALAFSSLTATGCSDTLRPTGATPEAAVDHSASLFGAVATRFDQPLFSPSYQSARRELAGSALTPSRIFNDSSLWSEMPSANTRWIFLTGTFANGRYRLDERRSTVALAHPADTRHEIALQQLGPSVYRWTTHVDMAIGDIGASDMSALVHGLLRAPANVDERAAIADFDAAFPRARAAFGRGFSVDSLRVLHSADGTASVALTLGFHPELMRRSFPALADYVDKYLGPAKYRFILSDRAGARLFTMTGQNGEVTFRYRLLRGVPVALTGPPRAWDDSLVLTSDLALRVRIFTIGFRNLVTDFIIADAGHTTSWTVNARREPDWDLPLFTERLLRTPLRQPFAGPGAHMEFFVHDSAGAQTLFGHRIRLDVEESAISRFIGSLAAHAMGDLNSGVEAEEDRFLHEGFAALAADTRDLQSSWSRAPHE